MTTGSLIVMGVWVLFWVVFWERRRGAAARAAARPAARRMRAYARRGDTAEDRPTRVYLDYDEDGLLA